MKVFTANANRFIRFERSRTLGRLLTVVSQNFKDFTGCTHGFSPGVVVGAEFPQRQEQFRRQQQNKKAACKRQGFIPGAERHIPEITQTQIDGYQRNADGTEKLQHGRRQKRYPENRHGFPAIPIRHPGDFRFFSAASIQKLQS